MRDGNTTAERITDLCALASNHAYNAQRSAAAAERLLKEMQDSAERLTFARGANAYAIQRWAQDAERRNVRSMRDTLRDLQTAALTSAEEAHKAQLSAYRALQFTVMESNNRDADENANALVTLENCTIAAQSAHEAAVCLRSALEIITQTAPEALRPESTETNPL